MPGPIPKRSEERRRRNKDGQDVLVVDLDSTLAAEVEIPAPPMRTHDEDGEELEEPVPEWHHTAYSWYMSLTESGQAIFYEASDWATAYMIAEQLSLAMEPRPVQIGTDGEGKGIFREMVVPMPGGFLSSILKAMSSLMTTEGERRRLRIELDRKKRRDAAAGDDNKVVSITQDRSSVFTKKARG